MDSNKEKLRSDYEDALMRLLMADLAEDEGSRLIEENRILQRDPGSALPQEEINAFRKAMLRAFDEKERAAKRARRKKILLRAAAICLAFTASFSALFFGVSAFREKVQGIFFQPGEVSTIVRSEDDDTVSNNYVSSVDVPDSLPLPKWMPDGYSLTSYSSLSRCSRFVFSDGGGNEIIALFLSGEPVSTIDTEDADSVSTVTIDGSTGMLTTKNGLCTLNWYDGDAGGTFRLQAEGIPQEDMLRIAQSYY